MVTAITFTWGDPTISAANYCTAPIHLAIPFFTLYLYSHRLTVGDLTVQFPTFCTCHFLSALVVVSLTLSELSVPSNSPHPLDYI